MQPHKPAFVYAPQPDEDVARQIDAFLYAHRLYRFHDLVEAPEDRSLPVGSRPVLRLALALADMADRQVEERLDEKEPPSFPQVFVADRLDSLGEDPVSQAAVLGTLLVHRAAVYVGTPGGGFAHVDDGEWWSKHRELVGDEEVHRLMDELVDSKEAIETHGARWVAMDPKGFGVLGTRLQRTWTHARQRRALLLEGGEFPTVVAKRLAVEGYQNESGRVIWYPSMAKGDQ